jgi:von Willebrand factor type A domain
MSLTEGNFGRPQLGQARGSDCVYLLDCSRSMGDKLGDTKVSKLDLAKAALVSVLSSPNHLPQDRIGVIAVNTNIFGKALIRHVIDFDEIKPLADSKTIPMDRIMVLKNDGGTALLAGALEGLKLLTTRSSRNDLNLFVITDSRSNADVQPGKISNEATAFHVKVHFIVLGEGKTKEKLKLVSDATGGRVHYARNQYELERSMFPVRSIADSEVPTLLSEPKSPPAEALREARPELVKLPPVTPKRARADSLEEIQAAVHELTQEYAGLEKDLRDGKISQVQFTESYSVIQYELQELRQSIREIRSKLSKEMIEFALVRGQSSEGSADLLQETSRHLTELDREITGIYQTAKVVNK